MRRYIVLPMALLFLALGVPSNAQTEEAVPERGVWVSAGSPLTVWCAVRVEQRAAWSLDGAALPADMVALPGERRADLVAPPGERRADHAARLSVAVRAERARPHHAGLYACSHPPVERVRVTVRPGETTTAASVGAASAEPAPAEGGTVVYYDVGRPFALNCTLAGAPGAYLWRKNGTSLEQVAALVKRYSLEEGGAVLRVPGRSTEDDYGNYSCALGDNTLALELRGRPHAKLQHNVNVVEKQPLKITCKMIGKPYPAVSWTFTNDSVNASDVSAALGERVELRRSEQGVEGGELVLGEAERADAGLYTCVPAGGAPATTTLRVKDQFAALWPFLGICAEVFVLCAIILVYEKRRTKPELDDSDTDNHDQKKS